MTAPRPCLIPARKADIKWETPQHRDFKTTQIYADYAPSAAEADWVMRAFTPRHGEQTGNKAQPTGTNSDPLKPL